MLSEQTYYEENFTEYNESAINLRSDSLQNQHLITVDQWSQNYNNINHDNTWNIQYGSADEQARTDFLNDKTQAWLQGRWEGDDTGTVGLYRSLDIPDGMTNPVLVIDHANWNQHTRDNRGEIGYYNYNTSQGRVLTTAAYDSDLQPGWILSRTLEGSDTLAGNIGKRGWIQNDNRRQFQEHTIPVNPEAQNITVVKGGRLANSWDNENNEHTTLIREVYLVNGSSEVISPEINGYQAIAEDDSFGGPDPYNLQVVSEPTASGKEVSLRSHGQTITRTYQLDGIDDAQKSYFTLEGTSNSKYPVQYTIKAFGQEVASGSISSRATSEEVTELNLQTDEVTVTVESQGQYDIHSVGFSALEETSQGDPLAMNSKPGGMTLNPDTGYDRTIGLLISGLDITTDTLLYVVMIALTVGFIVFSYTKSVRGQEMAQSLLFGAVIAGVVIVGVVPTMNLATWIFTGGVERAPLANPALEAEPPTYYSTEFQDGAMHGWEFDNARGQGSVRPVSVGETFDLQFQGTGSTPGIITHQEHISLGNSLSTGFVNIDGAAKSVAGYNNNPHEVTYNVRVYVTKDGNLADSEKLDPGTNFVEQGQSAQYLRNPVTSITQVQASVGGETRDLSSDFTIVDADTGKIRYEGNSTLANNESYSETLSSPTIHYDTHRNNGKSTTENSLEPGDTFTLSKTETSQNIAAVQEIARSFNGETMSAEQMVTFDLDGQYVHTELIIRSNRNDENPLGTLSSVRVGATTESGSVSH